VVSERLQALERLYVFELWRQLRELEVAVAAFDATPRAGDSARLQHAALSMAASASAFGLSAVSQAAESLAFLLEPLVAAPAGPIAPAAKARLRAALVTLRLAAGQSEVTTGATDDLRPTDVPRARPRRLLLVFEEDAELAGELAFQLGCFGFLARTATDPVEFAASLPHAAAVILDGDVCSSRGRLPAVVSAVVRHRAAATDPPPLLLVSPRDDLETRLRAVRFGADAFLTRPLDVRELVERLDAQLGHHVERPCRVLVVDDDYAAALALTLELQAGGMEVEIAPGAMDALRRLPAVDPDVVVANVVLAGCSGPELAAVIRQDRDHLELPVVFLSAGASLSAQLEAIRRGGNDLLPLPPPGDELLLTVRHYAQRRRLLRRFRTCDGLTGLLDFGSAMNALRQESRRAAEEGKPLALALIEVDALEELNLRRGHLAGDAVLRSLGDLLRQRFRHGDVLARFGRRFLVLLPDTDLADAVRILEETRVLFGEIHRRQRDLGLAVGFSCGVARQVPGQAATDVHLAAHAALTRARGLGGNRLETAGD
jgi:diguanylate cyclase (GGDEF)-like protein